MKRCSKCDQQKPSDAFYKAKSSADGLHGWCKPCVIAGTNEYKKRNADKVRETMRNWRARNRAALNQSATRYVKRNRTKVSAAQQRFKREHPEMARAWDQVYKAIQRGDLVRPSACEQCGKRRKLHAHHEDYSKPLDVRWVCTICHGKEHIGRHANG